MRFRLPLEGAMLDAAGNEYIKLDQFLKLAGVVETGGEAKHLILSGQVLVNRAIETRRGRKLYHGDVVTVDGEDMVVQVEPDESEEKEPR
jgi:ribosome-associated protein